MKRRPSRTLTQFDVRRAAGILPVTLPRQSSDEFVPSPTPVGWSTSTSTSTSSSSGSSSNLTKNAGAATVGPSAGAQFTAKSANTQKRTKPEFKRSSSMPDDLRADISPRSSDVVELGDGSGEYPISSSPPQFAFDYSPDAVAKDTTFRMLRKGMLQVWWLACSVVDWN